MASGMVWRVCIVALPRASGRLLESAWNKKAPMSSALTNQASLALPRAPWSLALAAVRRSAGWVMLGTQQLGQVVAGLVAVDGLDGRRDVDLSHEPLGPSAGRQADPKGPRRYRGGPR